jgi:hypothetical protein
VSLPLRSLPPPANHPTLFPRTHCTSQGRALPGQVPSSPSPRAAAAAAARPRRRPLRSNLGHPCALGELLVEPDRFTWRECRRLAGIGRSRAAPMAKGGIASPQVFSGSFVQYRGTFVRLWKVLGAPAQKYIFNSERTLLILVKSLQIVEKSEKCKLNFVRFLVKSTTTFVILTWSNYWYF